MKVTRFHQSCLLVELNDARILFDPSGDEKADSHKFGKLSAVFYTHRHSDHFDAELAKALAGQSVAIYANADTAELINAAKTVVTDGQEIDVAGVKLKTIELPHCPMPDGRAGPQNTGYLINGEFFISGDGVQLAKLRAKYLALPITGPDISMKDAFFFAKQIGAQTVIPVHYDTLGANPEAYAAFAGYFPDTFSFTIKPLSIGQTLEL